MPSPSLFVSSFSSSNLAYDGTWLYSTQPCGASHNVYAFDALGVGHILCNVPITATTTALNIALAPPSSAAAGFTPGDLFVGAQANANIYKIHSGVATLFATCAAVNGLGFDTVGTYGYQLIVTGYAGFTSGISGTVSSSGAITTIGDFGSNVFSPVVLPSGFPTYGGLLIGAAVSYIRTLATPYPGAGIYVTNNLWGGMCIVPSTGQNLYVAGGGGIYVYDGSYFSGLAGAVVLPMQAPSGGLFVWDGTSGTTIDIRDDLSSGACFGFMPTRNASLVETLGSIGPTISAVNIPLSSASTIVALDPARGISAAEQQKMQQVIIEDTGFIFGN